jgi:UDP-N-acetylmuramoylalanine--D-glutamate ligase
VIVIDTYRDRRVAVLGLGRTGQSVVRSLVAGGAQVLAWDDDPNRRAEAAANGARAVAPDIAGWQGIAALILSPGVPLTHPAPHVAVTLADRLGAEVIGDVELFARTRPAASVVAITGTNGKSTTTALVGHILHHAGRQVEVGANLGKPVLDFAELPADGFYVLELSSYQIDLLRGLRPAVAALINLSPDHLDRHGGMDGYIAAKRRLLCMAPMGATLAIGVDDEWCPTVARDMAAKGHDVITVSSAEPASADLTAAAGVLYRNGRKLVDLTGIDSLRGRHNWQNALIAWAVTEALGLGAEEIAASMSTFAGLPHRMEMVARAGGVAYVNDSKATNAEAASHALAANDRIFWIAGGIAKAGGIAELAPFFARIERAFLIGEAAQAFARTLDGKVAFEISGNLDEAVCAAHAAARAAGGGTVLLSPACASFDQFSSFEARGAAFRDLVNRILADENGPKRAGGAGC